MIINLSVENYKVKDRVVLNNFKLNIDKFNSIEDISKSAFIMINQLYYSFIIPESLKILYKILNNTYNFADQDLKIFSDPTKPIFISLYFFNTSLYLSYSSSHNVSGTLSNALNIFSASAK